MMVAGLGFKSDVTVQALMQVIGQLGQPPEAIAVLRSKCGHPALKELQASLSLPIIEVGEEDLKSAETVSHSDRVFARFGVGSIAEAVALIAARENGSAKIIAPRIKDETGRATAALAQRGDI